MKKLLLTAAAILATLSMYGQGTVNFSNIGAQDPNKVWLDAVGTANGGRLATSGGTYQVGLFYAPDGTATDDSQFVQIGLGSNIQPTPGLFSGGNRTIPASAAGQGNVVNFQVRGWEASAGSYDAAVATGKYAGKSVVFHMDTAFATTDPIMSVNGTATYLTGWQGFALVVPEPSVIGLGILGAGALLMLRRRK